MCKSSPSSPLLQYYSVLQSTTPVLLCTTKYYSSTTLYYKVLLQYYSALQSTTPVLLCTTKYYSSTTLYYKVHPVLLCTTKYYSSTTLYYKVLLQYYSVLQSTTPVLLCTTKYYSSTTLDYNVLLQYYPVLQSTTPVLLCMTTYYSSTTLYYRVLHRTTEYYNVLLHHIWNVIYNARSNMHHLPTSPNAAPATKNDAHHWLSWHMQRHLQCAEQQASPSNLTKYCACHAKLHSKIKEKFAENSWGVNSNAGTIRTWSDHDPTMNSSSRTRPFAEVTFRASETHFVLKITTFRALAIYPNFTEYCACRKKWHSKTTKYCACHEKWFSWSISVTYETSFTMRGATSLTLQPHQILRLPRKKNLVFDRRHIWNVIYDARSNKHHPPTSPNTAPAT